MTLNADDAGLPKLLSKPEIFISLFVLIFSCKLRELTKTFQNSNMANLNELNDALAIAHNFEIIMTKNLLYWSWKTDLEI